MFRFVHAADLHLDSPFRGLVDLAPHIASVLQQATFDAYDAIIDLCVERDVDALLVAGDVFDSADRSLKAQLRFVDGLQRLSDAGIRAFICHGNHDPLDGWEATIPFPDNVHRFGAEVECVALDPGDPSSPIVCGVSYPTREVRQSLLPLFPAREPGRFTVGLMHANVGAETGHESYAPCSLQDLEATAYDYWALGHVHTRQVLREGSRTIVYPGNPQGRHPNERGARGVYLAEASDGQSVALEFIPVDTVRWERIEFSIDEVEGDGSLLNSLEQAVEDAVGDADGRHLVYRLQLIGRGPLHDSLTRLAYIEDLRDQLNTPWVSRHPFAFCGRIDDVTTSPMDRDELLRGQDFIGDFLRLVDEARADETVMAELQRELVPLYQHARAGRYLREELPSLDEIRTLLAGAEDLALSELLDGDQR
jgi:DNA repair exonuclease SbcCD nuclease subunit